MITYDAAITLTHLAGVPVCALTQVSISEASPQTDEIYWPFEARVCAVRNDNPAGGKLGKIGRRVAR